MIATIEVFDEMVTEVTRQATRNAAIVNESALRYARSATTASGYQFAAIDSLQQAVLRSVFDLQNASFQFSRSVLGTASMLNRAAFQWATAVIWPWVPLGPLTEPATIPIQPATPAREAEDDSSRAGDCVMSALRFLGPMGNISSGMGEVGE